MLDRHQTRVFAFQTLFMLQTATELTPNQALNEVAQLTLPQESQVMDFTVTDPYLVTLVQGVIDHQAELDAAITPKLKAGWRIERLSKVDLIILRLGLYELTYSQDVPSAVVLDEAIEITKAFSTPEAARFVNGVLAALTTQND